MKPLKLLCLASAAVGLLALPALGDDIQPPPWRGQWSTTSQIWEFTDPVQPGTAVLPDGPAPGGYPPLPSTHLIYEPGPPPWDHWLDVDQDSTGVIRYGVLPLSGRIDVVVDNHEPPNDEKIVWVQITWRPQDVGERPILLDLSPAPPATEPPIIVAEVTLDGEWVETTFTWSLYPNPVDEHFAFEGTINVDQLVVDTWCIPEPAALSLLAIGVLAMIRKRR